MLSFDFLTLGNLLFFIGVIVIVIVLLIVIFFLHGFKGLFSGIIRTFLILLVAFVVISLLLSFFEVPNYVVGMVIKAINITNP